MSSILTKNFKILLAKQVYDLLDLSANSYLPTSRKSYVYAVIGKQIAWTNENSPPAVLDDDNSINDYYRDAIFAKQLSFDDASFVVSRINWETGTVYNTYESNTNFYVLTTKDQVFKCLDNNFGEQSTDEPEITLSSTSLEEPYIETGDGYKWKYMYSLTSTQKRKFLTDDWLPVTYNKFVRNSAIGGSIDIVKIQNSGNSYANGPTQSIITVTGDGSGAVLKANVANGNIQNIIIQERGSDYTFATLKITDTASGTNANAIVAISPVDGHGYDPVYELGATNILFSVYFENNESSTLPTDNDYRRVFLVRNPYAYGTTTLASTASYSLYTKLNVSPGTGSYIVDETVFQGTQETPTFSAKVISFNSVSNELYLNNIVGTPQTNFVIAGSESEANRVINSIENPEMQLYSGKVLYIINNAPITRNNSQTEQIRFILSF